MTLNQAVSNLLTAVAVGCAVVATYYTVRNNDARAASTIERKPTEVKDWQRYAMIGHRVGPENAKVVLVDFSDYECPVCKRFENGALRAMRTEFPTQLAVVYRHWPLDIHPNAYPAARAAECAAAQGKFAEYHEALFHSDVLDAPRFAAIAEQVGVADTAAFGGCIRDASKVPVIESDMAAVKQLDGKGTPTLLINHLQLPGAPDSARLRGLIEDALKSR